MSASRQLGRTGVEVSPLCLGAMMFGAWGNPDHDDSIEIIHAALDAGINFIDTADVYSGGESEEIVGKALAGGQRDEVVLATKVHGPMGESPTAAATRGAGSSRRSRTACAASAPTGSTSTRSTARPGDRHRRDARRAHRPGPRQGKVRYVGTLDLPGRGDRRGAVGRRARAAASASSASSRRTRSSSAASRPTCCRPASATGSASSPGARSPAAGSPAATARARDIARAPAARSGCPARYDLDLPGNQRKLDAAERSGGARRGGRHHPDRDGDRVRPRAPGRHRADHRPADDGAAAQPAQRRRRQAEPRRPRPDRRDRPARHHAQRRRCRLAAARPTAREPPPPGGAR